jgi:hypothetical protein
MQHNFILKFVMLISLGRIRSRSRCVSATLGSMLLLNLFVLGFSTFLCLPISIFAGGAKGGLSSLIILL